MKTKQNINRIFCNTAFLLHLILGLAVFAITGCEEEPEGFEARRKELLQNREYVTFGYKDTFFINRKLTFTGGNSIEFLSIKGQKHPGFYEFSGDSSFTITLLNPKDKSTLLFRDSCRLIYDKYLSVWWICFDRLKIDFLPRQSYEDLAKYHAKEQFNAIKWKYEQDKKGQWLITLENQGELAWEGVDLCLNGKNCDGVKVKLMGETFDVYEGSEHDYRLTAGSGRRLEPGKKMSFQVVQAVCPKTGRIFNPNEYGIAEIYAKGKVRCLGNDLNVDYALLEKSD